MRRSLIGSKAVQFWYDDWPWEAKDEDWLVLEDVESTKEVECFNVSDLPFYREIYYIAYHCPIRLDVSIVQPRNLLAIKLAHLPWESGPRFQKAFAHIQWMLKKRRTDPLGGPEIDLFRVRALQYDVEKVRGRRPVDMEQTNQDFFNDGVDRVYDHDSLHEAVAFYKKPLFYMLKRDMERAAVERDLFLELSYDNRIRVIQEELFVIALERWVIPHGTTPEIAYRRAFAKFIGSLAPLWLANYAALYNSSVLNNKVDFVKKFEEANENGKVRPFE